MRATRYRTVPREAGVASSARHGEPDLERDLEGLSPDGLEWRLAAANIALWAQLQDSVDEEPELESASAPPHERR